jgi:hypothetical protein
MPAFYFMTVFKGKVHIFLVVFQPIGESVLSITSSKVTAFDCNYGKALLRMVKDPSIHKHPQQYAV